MIIIYTDQDLARKADSFAEVSQGRVHEDLIPCAAWAEEVYFWRDGEVKVLKRRNAPLEIPEWLKDRKDVDK